LNQPFSRNDVASLAQGVVHTTDKNDLTILLVGKQCLVDYSNHTAEYKPKGETGTGKTTFLSLLANVLLAHSPSDYQTYHSQSNEAGGPENQSQTNQAKVYEFTSINNVNVRILDTPGLADTRGLAQDERHKASIAKAIQENITIVNAILILANGTLPRLGVATDYALSTLSSIFPRTLAENIGVIFTNVSSPLSWNFDMNSLPDVLRDANYWLLDNPIAMRKKFLDIQIQHSTPSKLLSSLDRAVEEGHTKALGDLAEMFNWLDGLHPQPTKDITSLYVKSLDIDRNISNALARMDQLAKKQAFLNTILISAEGTKLVCIVSTASVLTHHSGIRQ